MNDCLRTDVFVRFPPETIACACIFLSARKLEVSAYCNQCWLMVVNFYLLLLSFIHSFIHPSIINHWLINESTHSYIQSIVHLFIHLCFRSFIYSITHVFIHSFMFFIHSFFINLLICMYYSRSAFQISPTGLNCLMLD